MNKKKKIRKIVNNLKIKTMKKLALVALVGFTLFSCTKKDDKVQTLYKIEASGSNITTVTLETRDMNGEVESHIQYNQSSFVREWKGYNKNRIHCSIQTGDQTGVVKLYADGELIASGDGSYPFSTGAFVTYEN